MHILKLTVGLVCDYAVKGGDRDKLNVSISHDTSIFRYIVIS